MPGAFCFESVCDREVGLEPQLSLRRECIRDLRARLVRGGRERRVPLEHNFKEELRVEREGSRVEGHHHAVEDKRVRVAGAMRREQAHEICWREARVLHAREQDAGVLLGTRNEAG